MLQREHLLEGSERMTITRVALIKGDGLDRASRDGEVSFLGGRTRKRRSLRRSMRGDGFTRNASMRNRRSKEGGRKADRSLKVKPAGRRSP